MNKTVEAVIKLKIDLETGKVKGGRKAAFSS